MDTLIDSIRAAVADGAPDDTKRAVWLSPT